MRLYVEVSRATARRMSTYRGAAFAGVVTNTVFGFILAYVLRAVFRERGVIDGFDAADAVTFTFVTQGMLMVVGIFGRSEQADRVRTGEVAMDLSRPYDYQAWWAAVALRRNGPGSGVARRGGPRSRAGGTHHRRDRRTHLPARRRLTAKVRERSRQGCKAARVDRPCRRRPPARTPPEAHTDAA
jgi:hypothetical protein